jgi:pimeloyl-ACP methyl ester carboxylesterase
MGCHTNIYVLGVGVSVEYMKLFVSLNKNSVYIYYNPSWSFSDYETCFLDMCLSASNGSINLIGFSVGCIVSLKLCINHPYKIRKLVLIGFPSIFSYIYNLKNKNHNYQNIWSKPLIQKTFFDLSIIKSLWIMDYIPLFSGFAKKCMYRFLNPQSPDIVVDCVSKYNFRQFIDNLIEYLIDSNTNKLLKNISDTIPVHFVVGYNDEFKHVSDIVSMNSGNYRIHQYVGDHHVLYNKTDFITNKIISICN